MGDTGVTAATSGAVGRGAHRAAGPARTSRPARPSHGPSHGPSRDQGAADPGRQRADRPATFASLLRHREFGPLWVAGIQSSMGDQLARVALSVLVFARTGSGLATAATYALTYLPALVGGVALSGLADRFARRPLLVICDLVRAVVFGLMALPGLPLGAIIGLLVAGVLAGAPFKAAEPAVVADLFEGEAYSTAIGLRGASVQFAQLAGFGIGGGVVAAIGPRATLVVDAATFALSALLVRFGLRLRPAVAGGPVSGWARLRTGFGVVAGSPTLRTLLGLAWLAGWWVVPEGLAAPLAAADGGGPRTVGLLLAAAPAGMLIGAVVVTRLVPLERRPALIGPMAVATGLPLVATAIDPGPAVTVALWGLSGALASYQVVVFGEFNVAVPRASRGQAIGLAAAGLLGVQGLGLLLGGLMAAAWSAVAAIALAGAIGAVSGIPLARAWSGRARVPRSGGPT